MQGADADAPMREWRTALRVWRGDYIENRHVAHVAVVTADGRLVGAFNDPHRPTLVRSAAKPAQALAVLEAAPGLAKRLGSADLALMCASHSAEPEHLAKACEMMTRFGVTETDLVCGGHPSLSARVNRHWIREGFEPGAVCSNCSGKHIGMAAAAIEMTGTPCRYEASDHPLQQRVRQVLCELTDLAPEQIGWAVDGCHLPTPAMPLSRLARLYARLAESADVAPQHAEADPRVQRLATIYRSMSGHPQLVAGNERFCTRLMQAAGGALIGKVGAEGVYAVGLRARPGRPALGMAVKVEDGHGVVVETLVCAALRHWQAMPSGLEDIEKPRLLNTAGAVIGRMEPRLAFD